MQQQTILIAELEFLKIKCTSFRLSEEKQQEVHRLEKDHAVVGTAAHFRICSNLLESRNAAIMCAQVELQLEQTITFISTAFL